MTDDSLFFRIASLSNDLKQLKTEERMLAARLSGRDRYETTADHTPVTYASDTDPCQQSDGEFERLNELRIEIWEATVDLESLFFELAETEFARLASFLDVTPGGDLGAVCSAAVHAVFARYAQDFGLLINKNNNVAHLLVQFSSHLDLNDQIDAPRAAVNSTDATILRDETGTRCRGVRVKNQEVQFIDVEKAMDAFQTTVLAAVESWRKKRLDRMERRAELSEQLKDVRSSRGS